VKYKVEAQLSALEVVVGSNYHKVNLPILQIFLIPKSSMEAESYLK